MKNFFAIALTFAVIGLQGCADKKSASEQVAANVESAAYVLTPEDRGRAEANAKSFFNKEWAIAGG